MLSLTEINKLADKKSGVSSVKTLGQTAVFDWIDFVDPKTGGYCLPLEYLWGARGMVKNKMLKIEAEEGIGKSSYMMLAYGMGQCSKANCVHLEGESAVAPFDFIASFGCNPNKVFTPELDVRSIEACFNEIDRITSKIQAQDPTSPILVGVDSISSFGAGDSAEDEAVDLDVSAGGLGLHSRFLSKWFRDRWSAVTKRNVFLMVIAQLRANIKIGPAAFGAKDKTTIAARPLDYYSSFRLELSSKKFKDDSGEYVKMKTTKNKVSRKGKEIIVPLIFDNGFDMNQGLMDLMILLSKNGGIPLPSGKTFEVKQTGSWYECKWLSDTKFRSSDAYKFADLFYSDADLLMEVREALGIRGFDFAFEKRFDNAFSPDKEDLEEPNDAKRGPTQQ